MNDKNKFELIYAYTRKQAIADGVLIDVSATAKEAGFTVPVALTSAVFAEFVEIPPGVSCQDEQGRLWDILNMCRFKIAATKSDTDTLLFSLSVRNDEKRARTITLKSVIGPDDDGGPCITIMQTDED